MPKKTFVHLEHAREKEQLESMKRIKEEKVCPFCPEQLEKFHKKPILKENYFWLLTENQWPYNNTRIHLLVIHKKHAEKISDLSKGAWEDLGSLMSWAEKKFKITGGGFGMRFGDPKSSNATVQHVHAHLLSSKITDKNHPKYIPVQFKLG